MAEIVWKEFPEINRKIAFTYATRIGLESLGCHCGTITGVYATFGTGYHAVNDGKNIEVLDTSKEKPLVYVRKNYYWQAPAGENDKIINHLAANSIIFPDIVANGFESIVEKCSNVPLWVLSDVINSEAPFRKQVPVRGTDYYDIFGKTVDFVKYLIENKIGYVLASPIIQNPIHRSPTNYSLNQGWFWIPPKHLDRAIDVAEVYGDAVFPTEKEWSKEVKKDLDKYVYNGGPHKKILQSEVLAKVLNDGVFPESKRFRRDTRGRFIPGPKLKAA